eukprot:gnl/MRDRNA2_/MRDRNA2_102124_c0_seq1.p1 gnl/MRDRNA2_/MRDRNA2_102124_c0~~gnl/MRDRNA2_/MRDRNA2_102124_c0_seq1.p1  ORF type:complete len:941 (+),score=141.41 gnl/MRDRNA2_/MRDRNA2_102124_c0_seq1:231-3053(+)
MLPVLSRELVLIVALLCGGSIFLSFYSAHRHEHRSLRDIKGDGHHLFDLGQVPRFSNLTKQLRNLSARTEGFERSVRIYTRHGARGFKNKHMMNHGSASSSGARASAFSHDSVAPQVTHAAPALGPKLLAHAEKTSATGPSTVRFRSDFKCGKMVGKKLDDGGPVECDPTGKFPCCSANGWCGSSPGHCRCKGCADYRPSSPGAVMGLGDNSPPAGGKRHPPPNDPVDNGPRVVRGTVAVMIPFRDREMHLVKFKEFWRWFAKEGQSPTEVKRWEIYVVEQFDSVAFNRGWLFNVGFAIAENDLNACPDLPPDAKPEPLDCAVIQDIDYLPEKGVDYTFCAVPTQLSSEIDRYNWRTPYLQSAGGIVGANPKHWKEFNGFSNEYFGWGGEDDELYHRLRLAHLLYGDCHPFCKGDNDPQKGKIGLSIKRPAKGHGRFSGKFMHSMNHTKRITDNAAYQKNLVLLREIGSGSDRWRRDGLNNLKFRLLAHDVDKADFEEYGITYHHVKIRRGEKEFKLYQIPLAIPTGRFCPSSSTPWQFTTLSNEGQSVPFSLDALRERTRELLSGVGCSFAANRINFILVDQRLGLAKTLTNADPRRLYTFYRSLKRPMDDGAVIADPRSDQDIREAFREARAYWVPPADFSICTAKLKSNGPKYSVHRSLSCKSNGWNEMQGGYFKAFAMSRKNFKKVSYCDNEKHWIQRIAEGDCSGKWNRLKWVIGNAFYVPEGRDFCVGTRRNAKEEESFSRLLAKANCEGDGFEHDFSFGKFKDSYQKSTMVVCVAQKGSQFRVSRKHNCEEDGFKQIGRFAARYSQAALPSDQRLCIVEASGNSQTIKHEKDGCEKTFAIPSTLDQGDGPSSRTVVCVQKEKIRFFHKCGEEGEENCPQSDTCSIKFEAASTNDLALSTPTEGIRASPLYTLLEEESECFGFFCPDIEQALRM